MATNKFATMLHRNTNKLTLILVYALLEWILIVLLLLNSLFSYLILKFADFFGLSRPCLWCSRIDHIFEPSGKSNNSYRDLVCDHHASEIGQLGYCSNHRKLAESQHTCEDCSSFSRPGRGEVSENDEVGSVSKCSCCGVSVDASKSFSPCALIKPWGMFDDTHEGSLIAEAGVDTGVELSDREFVADEEEQGIEKGRGIPVGFEVDEGDSAIADKEDADEVGSVSKVDVGLENGSGSMVDVVVEKEEDLIKLDDDNGDLSFSMDDLYSSLNTAGVDSTVDASAEILPQHLDFFIGHDDYRLIPVDLIDLATEENQIQYICEEANQDVVLNFEVDVRIEREAEPVLEKSCTTEEKEPLLPPIHDSDDEAELAGVESRELGELVENTRSLVPEEEDAEEDELIVAAQGTEILSANGDDVQKPVREMDADAHIVSEEEGTEVLDDEMEAEVSIGTEIHDHKHVDKYQAHEDMRADEMEADVSIGTEIPDHKLVDEYQAHEDIKDDEMEADVSMGTEVPDHKHVDEYQPHEDMKDDEMEAGASIGAEIPDHKHVDEYQPHEDMKDDEMEAGASIGAEIPDHKHVDEYQPHEDMQDDEIEADVSIGTEIPDHKHVDEYQPHEDMQDDEIEADVSIGTEIPDHEHLEDMKDDEIEADVSIGTEIPDHEHIDEYQAHEDPSYQTVLENPSTSHDVMLATDDDHGSKKVEHEVKFKAMSVETSENPLFSQLSRSLELNDIEEDKVPDTPSSVESPHQFNRKPLPLERRESGTESLDGSVISDIEAGELSIEKLSSALRTERKALNALYAELEEERSASAVAANQTMSMINRLHEEKAAMQMEASQYQRMMEEQSEYDQEALQLLNELMVKREKEKQELERELEAYRKKVQEYEAREKMLMLRRKEAGIRSMTSLSSCSNAEDSDGSVDLNREVKEDDAHFNHQDCDNSHSTPTDAVLYLEESLANFEEERMSILEELKVLEEKLFTMNSEEEEHFDDVKTFENGHENGNDNNMNGVNGEANGHHKEMNGKHHQGTRTVSKPKRLLPLFDAIELEAEDGVLYGNEHGFDSASQHDSSDSRFELENKRPAIEEEVDHVYERLQALEADREFLKHCMSSLKKGDKGVYLLQEILQHLRDLRNVDLRARNMEDGVIQD